MSAYNLARGPGLFNSFCSNSLTVLQQSALRSLSLQPVTKKPVFSTLLQAFAQKAFREALGQSQPVSCTGLTSITMRCPPTAYSRRTSIASAGTTVASTVFDFSPASPSATSTQTDITNQSDVSYIYTGATKFGSDDDGSAYGDNDFHKPYQYADKEGGVSELALPTSTRTLRDTLACPAQVGPVSLAQYFEDDDSFDDFQLDQPTIQDPFTTQNVDNPVNLTNYVEEDEDPHCFEPGQPLFEKTLAWQAAAATTTLTTENLVDGEVDEEVLNIQALQDFVDGFSLDSPLDMAESAALAAFLDDEDDGDFAFTESASPWREIPHGLDEVEEEAVVDERIGRFEECRFIAFPSSGNPSNEALEALQLYIHHEDD